jgi:two-component system, OmpR family, response regulator
MENSKIRILLAEDDESLGTLLQDYLVAKNYEVDLFTNGERAFKSFTNKSYDICVLDIMMPVKDGLTLAKEIRMINSELPIVFLTAKSMKEDVLEGFKIGADDYMTKPFNMEELIYRIEAIMKRMKKGGKKKTRHHQLGKYTFDAQKQLLSDGENEHHLTTKESELLELLCNNMNDVLERNFALKTIWVDDNYFNARSMDVYVTKLRKYLKDEPAVQIVNVHGKGFKMIVDLF